MSVDNQLVSTVKPVVPPLKGEICKIDIVGFSLDHYKTVNFDGYTILCNLGSVSDGVRYFPKSSKLVLNTNQQSHLMANFDQLVPKIAEDFGISEKAACDKCIDFFSTTDVTVQPVGLQGKCYSLMKSAQNLIPMAHTHEAVSFLKTTGITGLEVITKSPLTFVGSTYIGALFFSYCGSAAGDNMVGLVFNSTSFLLSRPMRGVEVTLNGLLLRPISNLVGLPLVLNGTQEMLSGKGLSVEEYTKIGLALDRINNSTTVKKFKKIWKIIRTKDE
jgi:hypothetical protein